MYCGNCGTEIPDHAKFCNNCGSSCGETGATVIIPETTQGNFNQQESTPPIPVKAKKIKPMTLILSLVGLAVLACVFVFVFKGSPEPEGKYISFQSQQEFLMCEKPVNNMGTLVYYYLPYGESFYKEIEHNYRVSSSKIIIEGVGEDEGKEFVFEYVNNGEYLINTSYYLEGEIPAGKHFDASLKGVAEDKDMNVYNMEFSKDGKFKFIFKDGKEFEHEYEREGDLIKYSYPSLKIDVVNLIYNGRLYPNGYYKLHTD